MTKSGPNSLGPKNGRVAPEKSATPENGVTKGTAAGKKMYNPEQESTVIKYPFILFLSSCLNL